MIAINEFAFCFGPIVGLAICHVLEDVYMDLWKLSENRLNYQGSAKTQSCQSLDNANNDIF